MITNSEVIHSHPFEVFIFYHLELDMTEFFPFHWWGPLSFHRAVVVYDDQIRKLCKVVSKVSANR